MGSELLDRLKRCLLFVDELLTGLYLWLSMALAVGLVLGLLYLLFGT